MIKKDLYDVVYDSSSDFLILGLTGPTGSGCSTAAAVLQNKKIDHLFSSLDSVDVSEIWSEQDFNKFKILSRFSEKVWSSFHLVSLSDLITACFVSNGGSKFILDFSKSVIQFEEWSKKELLFHECDLIFKSFEEKISNSMLYDFINVSGDYRDILNKYGAEKLYIMFRKINEITSSLKQYLNTVSPGLYAYVYQCAGESIRRSSSIFPDYRSKLPDVKSLYYFPKLANRVVKTVREFCMRRKIPAHIVIDAFRNPYEVKFFKERYSSFYLVSIDTDYKVRKGYLEKKYEMTSYQVDEMLNKESGKKRDGSEISLRDVSSFVVPNIEKCVELADIHIFNPRHEPGNNSIMAFQLLWYFALMKHPGLVSPTDIERNMQMAMSAKVNSGCISRQVGAVVADGNNSIVAVGWNEVPEGQTPCNMRSYDGLLGSFNKKDYSEYERESDIFRNKAIDNYEIIRSTDIFNPYSLPIPYCFKSIHNATCGDRNQVHTRALHAEENAFLQIVKRGGFPIKGGVLYTTASPCELCAKKAYQLQIREIVYIDPYPGITESHVLSIGIFSPRMTKFKGAVGRAYVNLYSKFYSYKDEIEMFFMPSSS